MDDALMNQHIIYLKSINHRKFEGIGIDKAINSDNDLKRIMDEYKSRFTKLKYNLEIAEYKHLQCGKCTRFSIKYNRSKHH